MGQVDGEKLMPLPRGYQAISWALIISLADMLVGFFLTLPAAVSIIAFSAWIALGYVFNFTMLIGLVF